MKSNRRRRLRIGRILVLILLFAGLGVIGYFGWPVASEVIAQLTAGSSSEDAPIQSEMPMPIEDTNQLTVPKKPIKPDAGVLLENNFIFEQLEETDKNLIRNIKAGMMNCEEEIFLNEPSSEEKVNLAMHLLNEQDVELIHFSGSEGWTYMINPEGLITSIRFNYTMSKEELDLALEEMQNAANGILVQTASMSDYEKSVFFNDWLTDNVDYDLEAPNAHSAYGALVEQRAVCDGYAMAMSMLMNQAQAEAIVMHGFSLSNPQEASAYDFQGVTIEYDSNGQPEAPEGMGGHAWNAVKLDDGWYYLDSTFNDPDDTSLLGRHRYLNLSFDEICRSRVFAPHQLVRAYYPIENHSTYKWTNMEQRIASNLEEAQSLFVSSIMEGQEDIVLEISDPDLYEDLKARRQTICSQWASGSGVEDGIDWENGIVSYDDGLQILEFVLRYTE